MIISVMLAFLFNFLLLLPFGKALGSQFLCLLSFSVLSALIFVNLDLSKTLVECWLPFVSFGIYLASAVNTVSGGK